MAKEKGGTLDEVVRHLLPPWLAEQRASQTAREIEEMRQTSFILALHKFAQAHGITITEE